MVRLQMLVLILELLQLSWAECVEEVAKRKRIHASGSSVVDRASRMDAGIPQCLGDRQESARRS